MTLKLDLFDVDDEQKALEEMIADFLVARSPMERVREAAESPTGYDQDLWTALGKELDLTGIAVSAENGGSDAGLTELAIVSRALGSALAPTPYFATAVLAGSLLTELSAGLGDIGRSLLGEVAAGSTIATVGYLSAGGRASLDGAGVTARDEGGVHRLNGTRAAVPFGADADWLLTAAQTNDGVAVYAVRKGTDGLDVAELKSLDMTTRAATVTFANAEAVPLELDPARAQSAISSAYDKALVCHAASQAGGAFHSLQETVEYVGVRHQFGRSIGSFQAVKHGCADSYVAIEATRATLRDALTHSEPTRSRTESAVIAALTASETYKDVASRQIQYMGGMGYTFEADAHLYYKRAWTDAVLLGDHTSLRHRLEELVLPGADDWISARS